MRCLSLHQPTVLLLRPNLLLLFLLFALSLTLIIFGELYKDRFRLPLVGLWALACWDCGFESRQRHGCLSLVNVVCAQVEVSTTGRSLCQSSPAACVSLSVIRPKNNPLHQSGVARRGRTKKERKEKRKTKRMV